MQQLQMQQYQQVQQYQLQQQAQLQLQQQQQAQAQAQLQQQQQNQLQYTQGMSAASGTLGQSATANNLVSVAVQAATNAANAAATAGGATAGGGYAFPRNSPEFACENVGNALRESGGSIAPRGHSARAGRAAIRRRQLSVELHPSRPSFGAFVPRAERSRPQGQVEDAYQDPTGAGSVHGEPQEPPQVPAFFGHRRARAAGGSEEVQRPEERVVAHSDRQGAGPAVQRQIQRAAQGQVPDYEEGGRHVVLVG